MQNPKWQLPMSLLAAALGPPACSNRRARPLAHLSRSARPPLQPQKVSPDLWEVDTCGIVAIVKIPKIPNIYNALNHVLNTFFI